MPGLCESVQLKWSGDVDLNNGELQRSYQVYRSKLDFVSEVGLGSRQGRAAIQEDLRKIHHQLLFDKQFAAQGTFKDFKDFVVYVHMYRL